LRHVVLQSAGR